MLFEESPRTPPGESYTPITSAVIQKAVAHDSVLRLPKISEKAPPAEWLNVPSGSQRLGSSRPTTFEPRYQLMSARDRKMMHLRGETGSPVPSTSISSSIALESTPVIHSPRIAVSARRQKDENLVPATLKWTCSSPPSRSLNISDPPVSVRRRPSDLIAATQPWSSPCVSKLLPQSATPVVDPRRQANDLIPATMPWVTPYVTPSDRGTEKLDIDHRRKKGIVEENFPKSGSLVPSFPELQPRKSARPVGVTPELSRWQIRGVPVDGNEEDKVKKLLTQNGVHVVTAKAQIDIVSNTCNGCVEVLVRAADADLIKTVVDKAGFFIVH